MKLSELRKLSQDRGNLLLRVGHNFCEIFLCLLTKHTWNNDTDHRTKKNEIFSNSDYLNNSQCPKLLNF